MAAVCLMSRHITGAGPKLTSLTMKWKSVSSQCYQELRMFSITGPHRTFTSPHVLLHPSTSSPRRHYTPSSLNYCTFRNSYTQRAHFSPFSWNSGASSLNLSDLGLLRIEVSQQLCASSQPSRGLRGYPSYRTDKQNQDRKGNLQTHLHTDRKGGAADPKTSEPTVETGSGEPEAAAKLTLYQRFKKTYREHGKILVGVHLVTSTIWFGSFFMLAKGGFDIVPYLENWNFSEKIISPFRSGNLGNLALAYLLYKLATPARYTVTIGGTNLAIKYLRKEGRIPQVPQEDTIRSLYKEGKENLQRSSRRRHKNKTSHLHGKDSH